MVYKGVLCTLGQVLEGVWEEGMCTHGDVGCLPGFNSIPFDHSPGPWLVGWLVGCGGGGGG